MMVGSVLGVLFVSLVRRVMVEDPELPFPESVAASQIHKAGQVGAQAAKYLFYNMAFGALVFLAGAFNLFAPDHDFFFHVGQLGKQHAAARGAGIDAGAGRGRRLDLSPARRSARHTSASATSSGPSWRRSTFPAA